MTMAYSCESVSALNCSPEQQFDSSLNSRQPSDSCNPVMLATSVFSPLALSSDELHKDAEVLLTLKHSPWSGSPHLPRNLSGQRERGLLCVQDPAPHLFVLRGTLPKPLLDRHARPCVRKSDYLNDPSDQGILAAALPLSSASEKYRVLPERNPDD